MKISLRNKTSIEATTATRTLKAKKQGRTWKGSVVIADGETRLIDYTNGTMECELLSFVWDSLSIA